MNGLRRSGPVAVALIAALAGAAAQAQGTGGADPDDPYHGVNPTPEWQAEKCALFERAWTFVLDGQGAELGADFVEGLDRFITAGCTGTEAVCPAPGAEFAAADTLALMVVAESMTTTFLPFSCKT